MIGRSGAGTAGVIWQVAGTMLIVAGMLTAAAPAAAETADVAERGRSVSTSPSSTRRDIDAPRTRQWIRLEPEGEIHAYEIEPRSEDDRARVGAFLQRNPGLKTLTGVSGAD